MNLVIECLTKELERQNILIMADENNKPLRDESPEFRVNNPALESIYPNTIQFKKELENAISLLKTLMDAKYIQ